MLKGKFDFVNGSACAMIMWSIFFNSGPAHAATTTDIMNAMSACGGSTLSITNNTKEKVSLQLEQGVATGEVIQKIVPRIVESILGTKDSPLYDKYVSCMTQILSKGATVDDKQRALLADFSTYITDSSIRYAFGPPKKEVRGPNLITSLYEGSFADLYVVKNKRNQLYAIAVFAPNEGKPSNAPIPFLHAGLGGPPPPVYREGNKERIDSVSVLKMDNLVNFNVKNLISLCGDDISTNDVSARFYIFVTTPCSVGTAGNGKEFYFGFNPAWYDCSSREKYWNPLHWPKKLPLKKLSCDQFKNMHAEFVFIPILDCKRRCADIAMYIFGDQYWGDQYSELDLL
jgi:hypothetical protein